MPLKIIASSSTTAIFYCWFSLGSFHKQSSLPTIAKNTVRRLTCDFACKSIFSLTLPSSLKVVYTFFITVSLHYFFMCYKTEIKRATFLLVNGFAFILHFHKALMIRYIKRDRFTLFRHFPPFILPTTHFQVNIYFN